MVPPVWRTVSPVFLDFSHLHFLVGKRHIRGGEQLASARKQTGPAAFRSRQGKVSPRGQVRRGRRAGVAVPPVLAFRVRPKSGGATEKRFGVCTVPMPDARTRRGVALDMDGVIIDGMPFHVEAWQKAFARHMIEVSPTEVFQLEGIKSPDVVEIVCRQKGVRLSEVEKEQIVDCKRETYRRIFRVVPLRGSKRLVQDLKSYGYNLSLVTGTLREAAERALSELEIRECFSHIVSSESVDEGKPSPEPYAQALSGLDTHPASCIAVENAPPGVTSAKAAGIPCIAIATYLAPTYLSHADKVLESPDEAADWFKAEFARSGGRGRWLL